MKNLFIAQIPSSCAQVSHQHLAIITARSEQEQRS
jgi:hypothetical protein